MDSLRARLVRGIFISRISPSLDIMWSPLIKEVTKPKNNLLLNVCLLGYNTSDKPASIDAYVLDELAKDIKELAAKYTKDKFIVAGHDWGGNFSSILLLHL